MNALNGIIEQEFPPTIEAGPITLPEAEELVVASDVGSFSACDVWFRVPEDWVSRVALRVYGRLSSARVLLREVALENLPATFDGAMSSGIAVSLRGRPCRSFEVALYTEEAGLTGGYVYLNAWHGGAELSMAPGDDAAPGPAVIARLQARDSGSGALVDVEADSSGRLLIDNDVFGADFLRLPDVTSAPTPTSNEVRVYFDAGVVYAAPQDGFSVLGLTIPKRTGNGLNAGGAFVIKSQDGRNVSSGTRSDGGALTLSAGDVGTGGTAGTGTGGRMILKVGAGGTSNGTLDFDMAAAISNASPKTRWLLDGSEFASLQRQRVSGLDYTVIRSASGLVAESAGGHVNIKTGSSSRVLIDSNGLDTTDFSKVHGYCDTSALEHLRLVTDSTETNVPAVPTRLAVWQNAGRLEARTQRDVRHELNCQDTATGGVSKRIFDRLRRSTGDLANGNHVLEMLAAADLPGSSPDWLARFELEWGGYLVSTTAVGVPVDTSASGHRRGTLRCVNGVITVPTTAANQIIGADDDNSGALSSGTSCFVRTNVTNSNNVEFQFGITRSAAHDVRIWARLRMTLVEH